MSEHREKRTIGKHACERCRKSKVRCFIDTLEKHGKCRRCFAVNSECEWKEISTTRRRKRTDARVADLEKQISLLTSAMRNIGGGEDADSSKQSSATPPIKEKTASTIRPDMTDSPNSVAWISLDQPQAHLVTSSRSGLLSNESAWTTPEVLNYPNDETSLLLDGEEKVSKATLLHTFVAKLLPQYPVLSISVEDTVISLEQDRPYTFTAIISAASSIVQPELFQQLHSKLLKDLAQAVIIEGRKSFDLLQAVLVAAVWFHPPHDLQQLNLYQWTHIACTMAMDLGLAGRMSHRAMTQAIVQFSEDVSEIMLERYRTIFGAYLTCSRIAISFRRQRMLSYSPSTTAIIDLFEKHTVTLNDKRLVAWLRLQSIAEDIEKMKLNVEMRGDPSFLERDHVKDDFSLFHERLKAWEACVSDGVLNESIEIDLHSCKSKLNELALHFDYDIQDLDLPSLTIRSENLNPGPRNALGAMYIRALLSFINDCQSILEVVSAADLDAVRGMPILTMFRVPYAFKALAMLQMRLNDNEDNISKVIDHETIKFQHYANIVSQRLELASASDVYIIPATALKIRNLAGHPNRANGDKLPEVEMQEFKGISVSKSKLDESISESPRDTVSRSKDTSHYSSNNAFLQIPDLQMPFDQFWQPDFMDFDMDGVEKTAMPAFPWIFDDGLQP